MLEPFKPTAPRLWIPPREPLYAAAQRVRGRKFPQAAIYGKGAGGGGGGSTTITMTDGSAQYGAFGSISSFNMAVGSYAPTTDDLILFAYDQQGTFNGNTPSIGGVTATVVEVNATDHTVAIFTIPRGSGVVVSAGNVAVVPAGAGYGGVYFGIGFSHGNASSTPSAHGTTIFQNFASPNQISGVVASGGAGAVAFMEDINNLPISWLPSGWARVAATEKAQAGAVTSMGSCAVQGTPTAGSYTFDSQQTRGAYGFIAFA